MSKEDRLHKRLNSTHKIKNNTEATKQVFKAFGDYYGECADDSERKANLYLVGIVAIFFVLILSMMVCL